MIHHLDHFVLTTRDLAACIEFYTRVLGMTSESFGGGRMALKFGEQKINLHLAGHEFIPKAATPTPGSLDFCFIAAVPLDDVIAHLGRENVSIIEGPVAKTGAMYPLRSVYFRDPDGNLVEVSERAK